MFISIWEIIAAKARKSLREYWRKENGYSGLNFDDFRIVFIEQTKGIRIY